MRFSRVGGGACLAAHGRVKRSLLLAALTSCATTSPGSPGSDPSDTERVTVFAPYGDASHAIDAGATVLFYDANGALLDRETTGTDGRARSIPGPISTVVVVPTGPIPGDTYIWEGVSPGDHLYTERPAQPPVVPPDATEARDVSVTIRRFAHDPTRYRITAIGMSSPSQTIAPGDDPVTLAATLDPDAPATGDVVAMVDDGAARHFIVAHDVSLAGHTIDLRGSHWEDGDSFSATVVLPTAATWFSADYERLSHGRAVWAEPTDTGALAGDLSVDFTWPHVGDASALSLGYQLSGGTTWGLSYNEPPDAFSTAQLAPTATSVTRNADGSVSWTSSGSGREEIGVSLVLGGAPTSVRVLMPPGRRSFVPPPLPADLGALPPTTYARVTFVGGNEPGAYGALRNDLDACDLYRWARVMPALRGTYRFAGN